MMRFVLVSICIGFCGCQSAAEALKALPAGTQLQSSTTGLKFSPQAIDGVPFVFGSHTTIITTANPPDAGPNLNRFEAITPWIHLKSTVATGPIGDEIKKAGGPAALRYLIGDSSKHDPEQDAAVRRPPTRASRRSPSASIGRRDPHDAPRPDDP